MCFLDGSPTEDDKNGNHARQWETDMCHAVCNNCPHCFFGACPLLACFCVCYQRKQVLQDDMSKYKCCQGYVCPNMVGKCCGTCEGSCPHVSMCFESYCCMGCAMSATRLYLQEERQIATDPCDNRIIRLNNCLMILSCICNILAIFCQELEQIAQLIECIQYIVFYITAGCMIGQTALEMQRHPTAADY